MLTLDEWKDVGIKVEHSRIAIMRANIEIHNRKMVRLPSQSKTRRRLRRAAQAIESYKCEADAEYFRNGYDQNGAIYGTGIEPVFKTDTPYDVRNLIEQEAFCGMLSLPKITSKLARLKSKAVGAIDDAAYAFERELKSHLRGWVRTIEPGTSECVEIARRIEESLAGRNHRPSKESVPNSAHFPKGKSRDIAAEAVGWKRNMYHQAKAVVDSGNPYLQERSDKQ